MDIKAKRLSFVLAAIMMLSVLLGGMVPAPAKAAAAQPDAPTGVQAVPGKNGNTVITWTAPKLNVIGYLVYRSDSEDGEYLIVGRNNLQAGCQFEDKTGKAGKAYYYKVSAVGRNGFWVIEGKHSSPVSNSYNDFKMAARADEAVSPEDIDVVMDIEIEAVSSSSLKVTWKEYEGAETYSVWRAQTTDMMDVDAYKEVGTVSEGVFTDTGLEANTSYYYTVYPLKQGDTMNAMYMPVGKVTPAATGEPNKQPLDDPTDAPSEEPSGAPSDEPSDEPSAQPTPTVEPDEQPTATVAPSPITPAETPTPGDPTEQPTEVPLPSADPIPMPEESETPSDDMMATATPTTNEPSPSATGTPLAEPTITPTAEVPEPSNIPTSPADDPELNGTPTNDATATDSVEPPVATQPPAQAGTLDVQAYQSGSRVGATIAWAGVGESTNYTIYRSENGTDYIRIGTTIGLRWDDPKLKSSTTYYYKVVTSTGAEMTGSATTGVEQMEMRLFPYTGYYASSGVSVRWSHVTGASYYDVFRSTDGTSFEQVFTTRGLAFIDSNLQPNTQYYYKVVADNSLECTGNVTTPNEVLMPFAAPNGWGWGWNRGIRISWNRLQGATSYSIYRANYPGGEYVLLDTTTDHMWMDQNVDSWRMYYYKIEADNGSVGYAGSISF